MENLNHVLLKNVMQSLLSREENELLNSIIQKLNWNINDFNQAANSICHQKDIVYLIVLGDWIKEACEEIQDLYKKYLVKYNYENETLLEIVNSKFKAIRSFIVAHPLKTDRHPNEGYSGERKCIDIRLQKPVVACVSGYCDRVNADFYIAYYDNSICYKYEGHMYSEIWDCVYYNVDKTENMAKYLAKIRKKDLTKFN